MIPSGPTIPDNGPADIEVTVGRRGCPVLASVVDQPAAGADWSYVFTRPVRLVSVTAQYVASSAVASRFALMTVTDSTGNIIFRVPVAQAITASETAYVTFGRNMTAPGVDKYPVGGFPDMLLPAGSKVTVSAAAKDTGDQWSNCVIAHEPIELD